MADLSAVVVISLAFTPRNSHAPCKNSQESKKEKVSQEINRWGSDNEKFP